jgi:F-type H+-transporting ATPase subunit b
MGEITNQLGLSWGLFLAQVVNFLIVMFILRALLYRPVLNMMEQRKARIAESMKDAERASAAAQEAEQEKAAILDEARREAQEVRAQATRDAERIAQDIRSRAEQEAQEIRMKAQADAEEQRSNALTDVNKQIADLAILATERILGRELSNETEQRRFVQDFLEQRNGSAG